MIADYPRILTVLTSGNGIRYYYEARDPIVGREIDRGKVAFVIANQEVIQAALSGHPFPGTFLPDDMAAISGNYVQQWGVLWREGVLIPAGSGAFRFELRRDGDFVLAGAPVFDTRVTYWAGLLYLALPASVLTFSLYYPVVRKIGPAKAAYSSVVVPIIAMGFSTWLEDYRWTPLTIAGALLALGGMAAALSRSRSSVPAPDAA